MSGAAEKLYYRSPTWLQNLLVTAYGYHLYRKRYAGDFQRILEQVRQTREWSDEQIQAYQDEKLFVMVRHCRQKVPYYQKRFAEWGIHENDITSTTHLSKLPVLTKHELRANAELCKSPGHPRFMTQHTSGSTGTPLEVDVDEYTYKMVMALLVDHEEAHGIPFGAPRATFAGRMIQPSSRLKPPYSRMNRAENQKIFSSYHLNKRTFPYYAEELNNFRPVELIGYPSAISDLASYYISTNTKPGFKPSAVITNSETLLDWQREKIEAVFGCSVFDYYGTAEYIIFASQEADKTYRLSPLIGVAEIVQPSATGVPDNRLLATTLTNQAMPLLRYEVGDTAEPATRLNRSVIRRLARINGRVDDYIELVDGRRIGRLDHVFKGVGDLAEAQIVQDTPDHCTIYIVVNGVHSDATESRIKENVLQRVGQDLSVSVERVPFIPRGKNGKFKNVIRNCK